MIFREKSFTADTSETSTQSVTYSMAKLETLVSNTKHELCRCAPPYRKHAYMLGNMLTMRSNSLAMLSYVTQVRVHLRQRVCQ